MASDYRSVLPHGSSVNEESFALREYPLTSIRGVELDTKTFDMRLPAKWIWFGLANERSAC